MSNYEIQIHIQIRPTDDEVTEEAQQDDAGRFRTVVSRATGQSIDACEQALLRLNYPALRDALSRHLSEVSRQEASQGVGVVKKTLPPTQSMAK
jgi:uncharacterized protein (DUF2336 family)